MVELGERNEVWVLTWMACSSVEGRSVKKYMVDELTVSMLMKRNAEKDCQRGGDREKEPYISAYSCIDSTPIGPDYDI